MRVSVRLGLWLGLGLKLHKTSTLNINRNPQNVLFQVALGDIFGPEKKHASSSAVIGHIQQVEYYAKGGGGFHVRERGRERERERETARHIHLYTGTDLTIIDQ